MKIGVLTYYGDLNCGTNLQAYATLRAVKETYPDAEVEIIPFHGFTPPNVRPGVFGATIKSLLWDFRKMWKYKKFRKECLGVKQDKIIKDVDKALAYISNRDYDRIYVGADTLLELDRMPKGYDGLSAYWLRPEIRAEKFLLAASAKNVSIEQLTPKQLEQMDVCVRDYKRMCVRDHNTYQLLSFFVHDSRLQMVADPTFTLDIDYKYAEAYIRKRKLDLSNAICLHTLRGETWEKDFADEARKAGYKVFSFRNASWADEVLYGMSPQEQLGIYHYFRCFITHRFHDTVFCLKNNTPVISYPVSLAYCNAKGQSKNSALLDIFGLTDLCLEPDRTKINSHALFLKAQKVMSEYPRHLSIIEKAREEVKTNYMNAIKD